MQVQFLKPCQLNMRRTGIHENDIRLNNLVGTSISVHGFDILSPVAGLLPPPQLTWTEVPPVQRRGLLEVGGRDGALRRRFVEGFVAGVEVRAEAVGELFYCAVYCIGREG